MGDLPRYRNDTRKLKRASNLLQVFSCVCVCVFRERWRLVSPDVCAADVAFTVQRVWHW